MRINIYLVRAFQFLQQFCLVVHHKPGKEHIISDTLSRLANANYAGHDNVYSTLDTLYIYHTTLMEISPNLIKRILDDYLADDWWVKGWKQLLLNEDLGLDKAILPFVFGLTEHSSSADPYFLPKPKLQDHASDLPTSKPTIPIHTKIAQLIYHLNHVTGICQLCILLAVAPKLLAIAYSKGYSRFAFCHKIISYSWYIQGLTKILRSFIRHYPQCLALQTKKHSSYSSLQSIHSLPVLFFIFTRDFMLALSFTTREYNALISVTCKFSKKVILIEDKDTWIAKEWAYVFLAWLDLINWGLPRELITNCSPKFLNKFLTVLFEKLGVKLLYSTIYHPQIDESSKKTNQTVEIALRFFVHAFNNPGL